MNIDAQDNQDGRLLQETLTRAMIACGFEDVREHKPAVSGKNPVHPVHRCESKIYPCLTMNRFPATRRRRLFQASRAPAPHDGADHTRVKQVLFQISPAPALVCGSYKSETIRNRSSLRDLGIPSRLTSTPSWPFVDNSFFFCFRQASGGIGSSNRKMRRRSIAACIGSEGRR